MSGFVCCVRCDSNTIETLPFSPKPKRKYEALRCLLPQRQHRIVLGTRSETRPGIVGQATDENRMAHSQHVRLAFRSHLRLGHAQGLEACRLR